MTRAEIEAIAGRVRDELVERVRALGVRILSQRLRGCCGAASAALVTTFRHAGLDARLASGWFNAAVDSDPHYWALVGPEYSVPPAQWTAYAWLLDITATQFDRFASCPIVLLEPGALERVHYELEEHGDHLLDTIPTWDQTLAMACAFVPEGARRAG